MIGRTHNGSAKAEMRVFLSHHNAGILNSQCDCGFELRILLAQISWNKATMGVTISKIGSELALSLYRAKKTNKTKSQLNNLIKSVI